MRPLLPKLLLLAAALLPLGSSAQSVRVERNVVYGMYSGLALLLDVHRPARPNGYGIVFISGSGWQAGLEYGAAPLKEQQIGIWGPPLLAAGYTVFAINHRAAPRFHYPAAIDDVQRAIRFVRFHARDYGIDTARLGGLGGSSGGHLIGLAAMLSSPGDSRDADPVNRESAALQAVVLRAPLVDLRDIGSEGGVAYVVSFMESPPSNASTAALYAEASPLTHVDAASPPTLLLHGDADALIPPAQSQLLESALRKAGAPVKLLMIPGGVHAADFGATPPRKDWPDFFGESVRWFDRHLRGQ